MLSEQTRRNIAELEQTRDELARAIAQMADNLAARDELIRWLALPYAGDPVFSTAEDVLTPGHDPTHKRRLEATWREVVGARQGWGGTPGAPGYWWQCNQCGQWSIHNTEVDDGRADEPNPAS